MHRKKAPRKRTKKTIAKPTALATKKRLITSLLDGVFENTSPEDTTELAEHILKFGVLRMANAHGMNPEHILVVTPTDPAIRLIGAIQARAASTGETDDVIVNKVIAELGSDAQIFLPN